MRVPHVTTIDFETQSIEGRPNYPPKPVGVAIKPWRKKGRYFAWGHPTGNNCTKAEAVAALKAVWGKGPVLFFNGKFDVDVAETHLGMPRLTDTDIHDAMFIMFLRDPHARELGLKPLADRFLNTPPDEQDELKAWIMSHKKDLEAKYGVFKPSEWGAMISKAPGALVGKYAVGDVDRTEALFIDSWDWVINEHEMLEAYEREQKVMPIFLDNERVGIRIDVERLRKDIESYSAMLEAVDAWLRKRLKSASMSLDNDAQVLEALLRAGVVRENQLALTKTGRFSISKASLTPDMYADSKVASAFGYRNRLTTCLKMFMLPWLIQAEARGDGHISTNWNQVRGEKGGTRTGRPSTTNPNFLNISKTWDNNDDGYKHPSHLEVDALPLVRRYLLPDVDAMWLHRDYNGQELRVLAHFEDGPLMQAYRENPWMDVHQHVADLIETKTGKTFARKQVKIANFRIIYGGGAPATASGIGCSIEEAKSLLAAHGAALPSVNGRGGLSERIKKIAKDGGAIYTWGGRAYYVEPPSFSKKYGRHMTYEYKMLNYECQGSAADVTKQAMINYNEHPKRRGRFLVQVYDEMNSSSPAAKAAKARRDAAIAEMQVLRDSMEAVSKALDVPMLSEGKWGLTWADQEKFTEGASEYA
jgi:DNA polymerase I-like protein with 3'-5' exonuclease and polymerase domains